MTRRRRLRRRLLWAGVLLCLVLLVSATSIVRAALWVKEEAGRLVPSQRRPDAFAE